MHWKLYSTGKWKNWQKVYCCRLIGDLEFPGMGFFATPTARTIVSRVENFKGGVKHRNNKFLPPEDKYFFTWGYTSNNLDAWGYRHPICRTGFYPPARLPGGGGDARVKLIFYFVEIFPQCPLPGGRARERKNKKANLSF